MLEDFTSLQSMSFEFDMNKRKRRALAGGSGLEACKVICREETKELAYDTKVKCK